MAHSGVPSTISNESTRERPNLKETTLKLKFKLQFFYFDFFKLKKLSPPAKGPATSLALSARLI